MAYNLPQPDTINTAKPTQPSSESQNYDALVRQVAEQVWRMWQEDRRLAKDRLGGHKVWRR